MCRRAGVRPGSGGNPIPAEGVLLDPGIDLGKTWRQSLALLASFDTFAALGHPLLAAPSNKIFLGRLLGRDLHERGPATIAACALAVAKGARVVRVHEVQGVRDAVDLAVALHGEG